MADPLTAYMHITSQVDSVLLHDGKSVGAICYGVTGASQCKDPHLVH